jgi:hypothetical protein
MSTDAAFDQIVSFLVDIGLAVRLGPLPTDGAVPGITIEHGGLVVDPTGPFFPGDLLHEAGHLALLPATDRMQAEGKLDEETGRGFELGAIGWSGAAALHLDLPLEVVFHGAGYRDESAWLIDGMRSGVYLGVPLLQWAGLTWEPGKNPPDELPYPAMRRWLRA